MYKASDRERYENILISNKKFMHTDYQVSAMADYFHVDNAYIIHNGPISNKYFGINKRNFKVSGQGRYVDGHYIGQADS